MKFNKELDEYKKRYIKYISNDKWFNYKYVKKVLKYTIVYYSNVINNIKNNVYNYDNNEECCICLENDNLMRTFCCHNYIHHKCLVHSLTYSKSTCPLCRSPIEKVIKNNKNDEKEGFDTVIIRLLSNMHLNIMNIEEFCINNKLDKKIISVYKRINYKAIIKICKKINKRIGINIKEYFINLIEKRKILIVETPQPPTVALPTFLGCFLNRLTL